MPLRDDGRTSTPESDSFRAGGTGFNGESFAGLTQNVVATFDAGEFPFVVVYANFLNGFPQLVTVSGYLENCSVVGRAAVQH